MESNLFLFGVSWVRLHAIMLGQHGEQEMEVSLESGSSLFLLGALLINFLFAYQKINE